MHREMRDLLDNFSKRNDMYLAYKSNDVQSKEIEMKINNCHIEKLRLQHSKKDLFEYLQTNFNLTYGNILNLIKTVQAPKKRSYIGFDPTKIPNISSKSSIRNLTIDSQNQKENLGLKVKDFSTYLNVVEKDISVASSYKNIRGLESLEKKRQSEQQHFLYKIQQCEKLLSDKEKEAELEHYKLVNIKQYKKKVKTQINDLYMEL